MIPSPDLIAADIAEAVRNWNARTPRGQQTINRQLGVSDIGNCREYIRLMVIEQEFTDEPDIFKAFIGSHLGEGIEAAMRAQFPEIRTQVEMKVTLPNGISLTGHPDIVVSRGVLDIKTVDGLTMVRRTGPSEQQQFQRHLYAAGLVQEGVLDEDCFVGNVWFDRSGRDSTPHVQVESYDPIWLHRASEWIEDVFYAVEHNEQAPKDRPVEWCQVACPFFTACRGADVTKDREGTGLITSPDALSAVEVYLEGQKLAKEAEKLKDDARRALANTHGSTGTHIVRWTNVGEVDVPGFTRAGYSKLEVRPIPRPKR